MPPHQQWHASPPPPTMTAPQAHGYVNPHVPPFLQSKHEWQTSPPRPRTNRILIFVPPLLIAFPMSLALFALEQISTSILDAHKDLQDFDFDTFDSDSSSLDPFSSVSIMVNTKPTTMIGWTSIITALLALVAAAAFWELRKEHTAEQGRRAKVWAWANIVITLGNLALVVACTAVVFLAQKSDNDLDVRRNIGRTTVTGTRETILCGLKDISGRRDWASAGCGFAATGRWMLIPLGMCSLTLVGLGFWQIGKRGGVKWLLGGKKQTSRSQESEMGEWVGSPSGGR